MKGLIAAMLLIPLLTACDRYFGVVRSASNLSLVPPYTCVIDALQSIPGIATVSSESRDGSRPLTFHGIEKPDKLTYYHYKYQGVPGWVYFSVSYRGKADFRQGQLWLGVRPNQQSVDTLYPALGHIEEALETQCALGELAVKIHQQCYGVRCGA